MHNFTGYFRGLKVFTDDSLSRSGARIRDMKKQSKRDRRLKKKRYLRLLSPMLKTNEVIYLKDQNSVIMNSKSWDVLKGDLDIKGSDLSVVEASNFVPNSGHKFSFDSRETPIERWLMFKSECPYGG